MNMVVVYALLMSITTLKSSVKTCVSLKFVREEFVALLVPFYMIIIYLR